MCTGQAYAKFPSRCDPSLVAPLTSAMRAPAPLQAQEQTLRLLSPARGGKIAKKKVLANGEACLGLSKPFSSCCLAKEEPAQKSSWVFLPYR